MVSEAHTPTLENETQGDRMDTFLLQHALDSKVAPGENQGPGSLLPVAQGLDVE